MKNNRRGNPASTGSLVIRAACCLLATAGMSGAQPAAPPNEDLLRFLNGDSLHGRFLGMPASTVIRWSHAEAREPIVLDTAKLRHLAFNGGRAPEALHSPSFVLLRDGDRIPGRIVALDGEKLTIETEVAGTLTIPRHFIRQIAPNPHGGAVHYVGPFAADDWTVIETKVEAGDGAAPPPDAPADPEPPQEADHDPDDDHQEGAWVFSGGAYYSNSQWPIAVDTGAPDKARIRFTLAWRNRLNAAIAFHATMEQPPNEAPEAEDAEDEAAEPNQEDPPRPALRRRVAMPDGSNPSSFALTYGTSYVLTIYSNYAQLYRCTFDEEGQPVMDRLSAASSNLRLEEAGETEFELRCDRKESSITLFADGNYISQWEDPEGYAGTGSHLAFACQSSSSRLRVSDLVVTSWNGMIDSARSMEVEDRDIVLLNNGTDRFSGNVAALKDGKFQIDGTYAGMQIPIEEVQEIRLASADPPADPEGSQDSIRILLQPLGRLTVMPLEATAHRMKARHPALGDLDLDLRYSGLIEFSFSDSVLDSWDDDF